MKKLYEKNELYFAFVWIVIYVVLCSVADSVSVNFRIAKIVTAPVCVLLTLVIHLWVSKHGLKEKYGLCSFKADAKKFMYFIPLLLLASTNLLWGVQMNMTLLETVLYVISMLCVGYLEEMIFRGFLFRAMCKSNVTRAIIISSATFGFGHVVNLLNGKDIPETLAQMCYAFAAGFLFTVILYKGRSLWPCILTHSVINSLSAFANVDAMTPLKNMLSCIFLCVVSVVYTWYIWKNMSDNNTDEERTVSI